MKLKKILLLSATLIPMIAYGSNSWAGSDHDGVHEITFGENATKGETPPHVKMMPPREQLPISQTSREIIHDAMRKAIEKDTKTIDAIRKAEQDAHDILTAQRFDKKMYLKKTAEVRKLRDALMKSKAETMATIAEKLPADDRQFLDRPHPMMGHRMKMQHPEGKERHRPMMSAPDGKMPPCPMMDAPQGAKPMPPMDMDDRTPPPPEEE